MDCSPGAPCLILQPQKPPAATALRRHVADSPHRKPAKTPTTLHDEEPLCRFLLVRPILVPGSDDRDGELLAGLGKQRAGGRPGRRQGGPRTPDQAREFVANNHRAVMITRRSAGGLQTSPVTVGIDSDGKVVISSRKTAYKVRNLRRHPTATLCVFSLATPDDAVQRRLANSPRRAMPPTA